MINSGEAGIFASMYVTRTALALGLLVFVLAFSACARAEVTPSFFPDQPDIIPKTPSLPPVRTAFPTEEILRGTISIRHSWDETKLPVLAQIIKNFQALYPNVLFDVMFIPKDILFDRFAADSREGIGPTLLLAPAEWGPSLFDQGLVSDITGDVNQNVLDTLNQPALKAAEYEEQLIGLPYTIQGVVLFRNQGIITIKPDTFHDLMMLAQTSSQGDVIGAYLERSFFYSGAHLSGIGGQLIDENNLPGFNNGKGIEWLELLKLFEQAGPTCFFSDDDLERFKAGKVGWIIDGTWNISVLEDAIGGDKLAIDPWPVYGDGRLSGYVTSENIYLNAKTNPGDRRAALRFMEFLVSPESQTLLAENELIPSAIHVFLSSSDQSNLMSQAIQALSGGAPYPVHPEISIYRQNIDNALRAYLEQGVPADQALQNAQDMILSQSADTAAPTQP